MNASKRQGCICIRLMFTGPSKARNLTCLSLTSCSLPTSCLSMYRQLSSVECSWLVFSYPCLCYKFLAWSTEEPQGSPAVWAKLKCGKSCFFRHQNSVLYHSVSRISLSGLGCPGWVTSLSSHGHL